MLVREQNNKGKFELFLSMALEDRFFSSISEAKENFMPFRILGSKKVYDLFDQWVFWSHDPDENSVAYCSVEERIRRFLMKRLVPYQQYSIVQFWEFKRVTGSKWLLTTTHQPFLIDGLNKAYCSYRKKCMRRNIDVGPEADESQLGPPGRAYRSGFVETCPDIQLYTIQEFPLRDHAILCGLKKVVALPVFELDSNDVVGVLEFLCHPNYTWLRTPDLEIELKEEGLRTYHEGSSSESMDQDKYSDNVVKEIDKMFKEVAKRHPLALGLALAPCCKEYCLSCSCTRSLDNQIVVYINQHMNGLDEFIEEYNIHRGIAVSGRALASGKSCFCRDIRNLSLLKYPCALYARHVGLTFSFSICVQSIQDENSNLLVLEFFLLPGCYSTECISLLSGSLLAMIKELVSGYKLADEDFPGEELFPETCDSLKHDEIDCIQVGHSALSFAVTLTCGCDSDDDAEYFLDNDEAVVDFFLPAKLSYENEESFEDEESSDYALVLWNHDAGKRHGVEERIKLVFEHLPMKPYHVGLLQFWAPIIANRSFLTTCDQPFALGRRIKKVTCLYRKECMRRNIYIDEEGNSEGQLSPAGRAFKNGVAESSPDLRLYTIQEFQLRDHAVLWGIKEVVWLPVFEVDGKGAVGVLEILVSLLRLEFEEYLNCLTRELKKMGLRIDYVHPQPGKSDSQAEIKNMFEAISVTQPLHFARALIPSQGDYCLSNSASRYFKQEACYTNPVSQGMREYEVDCFSMAGSFHYSEDKYGVAGKALASRRSCFNMNICNFGISDYPLAHYAKLCGFSFSVAICVQNTQCVSKICVLEFFLLPGDYSSEYIGGLLDSLLIRVKQHLPNNFKILSEVPREPLFLEIGNSLENGSKAIRSGGHVADGRETNPLFYRADISGMHVEDDLVTQAANIFVMHDEGTEALFKETISEMHVADGTEATPLAAQLWMNSMMHVDDGIEATLLVPQGENVSTIHVAGGTGPITERESICSTKSSTGQLEGNKFHICLDELKLHFGKPLDEAAKDLGVSRSTLKRIRKSYGIQRWPSHKKNKVNQSLFMKENLNHAPHTVEDIMVGSSGTDSTHPGLPMPTRIHSTHDIHTDQYQTVSEVDRFVTIKASHRDVMLKFLLNSRSSLKDLQKEVAKRLKVQAGRCNMKYQDEDGDCISITIDEDLQRCLQSLVARNQTIIRMSVHLN